MIFLSFYNIRINFRKCFFFQNCTENLGFGFRSLVGYIDKELFQFFKKKESSAKNAFLKKFAFFK